MRTFILLLSFGLALSAAAQNRGMLVAGGGVLPVYPLILNGKLAYYRPVGGPLFGIKGAVSTNVPQLNPFNSRLVLVNIDLVRRWSLRQRAHSRIWLDTGVSGLRSTGITPPLGPTPVFIECAVVGGPDIFYDLTPSPETTLKVERHFYPGLALALNCEFLVGKQVFVGLDMSANTYYSPEKERVYTCPSPSVNASFPFR